MTMITSEDFNPERVQRLIKNNKILHKAYLRQTKGKKGGPEVLKVLFNALIRPDRNFMEEYQKTAK